jgi:3-oxoacyl-[acyl-carrier-protein] synthase II
MRRVVVTGIGALTPVGNDFRASWSSVKRGLSGIASVTRFDASAIPWKVAGEVRSFEPSGFLSRKEAARLDPVVHYAVAATAMAVADAGLSDGEGSDSAQRDNRAPGVTVPHGLDIIFPWAVVMGSSRGGITTIDNAQRTLRRRRFSPFFMPSTTIGVVASYVAERFGIHGPCLALSSACASGSIAVGEAARMIRHGYVDGALAGGSEAPLCRLCVEGYGAAGALSKGAGPTASRPFDATRDGFVLAEGACVLVLEEAGAAIRRGSRIYGEIAGYHTATDSFHMTRPDPEGEARTMQAALNDSRLSPDEIDYVSTHATSTVLGDKAESKAIRRVFGGRPVPVSALKSMTGHMLAPSGPFEIACALMCMREGVIPPTANLSEKDPSCDVAAASATRESAVTTALCNSFGFGGINAVVVLRKFAS